MQKMDGLSNLDAAQRSSINLLCFVNLQPRSSRAGLGIEPTDAFDETRAAGLVRARDLIIDKLAQQVRDGMNLHLRCVCESERCHGERLRTSILSMAATLSQSVIVQPH